MMWFFPRSRSETIYGFIYFLYAVRMRLGCEEKSLRYHHRCALKTLSNKRMELSSRWHCQLSDDKLGSGGVEIASTFPNMTENKRDTSAQTAFLCCARSEEAYHAIIIYENLIKQIYNANVFIPFLFIKSYYSHYYVLCTHVMLYVMFKYLSYFSFTS